MKNNCTIYMVSVLLAALLTVYFFANNKQENINAAADNKLLEAISKDLILLSNNVSRLHDQVEYIAHNNLANKSADVYVNNDKVYTDEAYAEEEQSKIETLSAVEQYAISEEQNSNKQNILASLNNPSITLVDIMESSDMKKLPAEMQNEIMQQVVVKFNNGELAKDQFIPGYKE